MLKAEDVSSPLRIHEDHSTVNVSVDAVSGAVLIISFNHCGAYILGPSFATYQPCSLGVVQVTPLSLMIYVYKARRSSQHVKSHRAPSANVGKYTTTLPGTW